MSFAEAHDYIRDRALKAKPTKWLFWFRDAQYDAATPVEARDPYYQPAPRRAADDLPLSQRLALEEREARNA